MKPIILILSLLLYTGCSTTNNIPASSSDTTILSSAAVNYNQALIHQQAHRVITLSYPQMLHLVSEQRVHKQVMQDMQDFKITKITIEHISTPQRYSKGLFSKIDTRFYLSLAYPKNMSTASFIANIKNHLSPASHIKATINSVQVDFPSYLIAIQKMGKEWRFAEKEYIEYIPKEKIFPPLIASQMRIWGLE